MKTRHCLILLFTLSFSSLSLGSEEPKGPKKFHLEFEQGTCLKAKPSSKKISFPHTFKNPSDQVTMKAYEKTKATLFEQYCEGPRDECSLEDDSFYIPSHKRDGEIKQAEFVIRGIQCRKIKKCLFDEKSYEKALLMIMDGEEESLSKTCSTT